jgi:hypothetical protein
MLEAAHDLNPDLLTPCFLLIVELLAFGMFL